MLIRLAPRVTSIRLSALLLAASLGCSSSKSKPTAPRQFKAPAARMGVVSGFVVDDETGAPIANAQISVGGTAVRARADGSFDATVPAGRARVEVKNEGFIQTVREVAVGDVALTLPFKLARRELSRPVGTTGGSYPFREALLTVPPGVFGDGTLVSLTYLGRVRVAVTANSPQFVDADNTPRRVVATVDLDASAPPAAPVRVRVPVPTDATMDSVKAFTVTPTGDWGTALMPLSVSGGNAEFLLMGNGRLGVAIDARRADGGKVGYLVTEAGGAAMSAGDVLPGGQDVMTASRAVSMVDPQGTRIEVGPASRARAEVPAGESGTAARVSPFAGSAVLAQGTLRALVPKGSNSLVKLTIQTPAARMEARGTAFSVTTCESGPGFVDTLSVTEGTVDATFGGQMTAVAMGESVTFCTSCPPGAAPMCFASPDAGMPSDAQVVPVDTAPMSSDMAMMMTAPDVAVPADMAPVSPDLAPVPADADRTTPDAGAPDAQVVRQPDADIVTPDAMVVQPDAMVVQPDAMVVVQPDAMVVEADADVIMPDADVVMPDTAVVMPDAAVMTPDAAPAKLVINPPAGDYGTVLIGSVSNPIDFTVTNTGDEPSGTPSPTVTGEYYIMTTTCQAPLPPQGTCLVRVTLQAMSAGTKNGSLNVPAVGGPGGVATVPLTGFGADQARLEVMPATFNFPNTAPGQESPPITFTVKNIGGLMSGTPAVSIGGTNAGAFTIKNDGCTSPLTSGTFCYVMVAFKPLSTFGIQSATLNATATPGGNSSAQLNGNSTLVEVTPVTHDFGDEMAGGANMKSFNFTVKHIGPAGSGMVTIVFSTTGPNVNDFTARSTDCSGANGLQPGDICTIGVDFKPGAVGARSAELNVTAHASTGLPAGTAKATLAGNGI
jgi:hypothetical protein